MRITQDVVTPVTFRLSERTTMSGPIIRTGTNPKFWEGWDKVFAAKGKRATAPKKAAQTEAAKAPVPAKKAAKKTAKKAAKK